MRVTPQVLDLQCSFLKNQKTGKANSHPWRLEEGSQMRRGAGRIITEIGGPAVIGPIRGWQFSKGIFKKSCIGHTTTCTAAWAMAMSATVRVGRTILAWMDVVARVSRRGYTMVIGRGRSGFLHLDNPCTATCLYLVRWQSNETSGEQKQYAEVGFHYSGAKICSFVENAVLKNWLLMIVLNNQFLYLTLHQCGSIVCKNKEWHI